MDTEEAKQTMRARASLCELTNGHAKTRFAMASLLVGGLDKVTCVALLTARTVNLVAHAALLPCKRARRPQSEAKTTLGRV